MNSNDPLNHLVTEYLQPSFTWLDENQIWLGAVFGLTLYSVAVVKSESRRFWLSLLLPQLTIPLLLVRGSITQGFWEWLEFPLDDDYPLTWCWGAISTLLVTLVFWRKTATFFDWVKFSLTKKTRISRRKKTDIIELNRAKPFWLWLYRVERLFGKKNKLILGKYPNLKPCFIDLNKISNQHVLIRGASGFGKSTLLQIMVAQYTRTDFVALFNPAVDEHLLKAFYYYCHINGQPFTFIDILGGKPQFALFESKTVGEIEEMILADSQFVYLNDASVFYTNFDRDLIYKFSQEYNHDLSLSQNWGRFEREYRKNLKNADKFRFFMCELCRLPAADAMPGMGFQLEEQIMTGGGLHVQCTTKSSRGKRLQNLLVVSIAQWQRKTKSLDRPYARLIFEEFKFFVNPEVLDLLSIGRSDRCGVTIIHQSRTDMLTNELGMDPEAVLGCIEENSNTHILFRTNSVDTSKHAEEQSAETIGEEEIQSFETNFTLSEVRSASRSLREVSCPHKSRNEFMSLHRYEAIKFGDKEAELFRFAPLKIPRSAVLPKPTIFPEAIAEFKLRSEEMRGGPLDVGE